MDTFKFAVRHLRPLRFVPALPQLFDTLLLAWSVLRHPPVAQALDGIERALLAWPGVTKGQHRFGGTEFRFGGREIGHLHGNGVLDIPLTKPLREQLVADGRARPHHIYPRSGWITFDIRALEDAPQAISLLRLAYDRLFQTPGGARRA